MSLKSRETINVHFNLIIKEFKELCYIPCALYDIKNGERISWTERKAVVFNMEDVLACE